MEALCYREIDGRYGLQNLYGEPHMNSLVAQMLEDKFGTYLPKNNESRSRWILESLLESGRKRIIVVTGELDKTFYTHEIGKGIANTLHRGIPYVDILLTEKVKEDNAASVKALVDENFYFFKAIYDHMLRNKTEKPIMENLHFFFSEFRQDEHFTVVDNDVFVEGFHAAGKPRGVYIKRNSRRLAEDYSSKWNSLKQSENVYEVSVMDIFKAFNSQMNEMEEQRASYGLC